jgi:DNA-directed RNA polymerase specialized sigma24 family protein
MTQDPRPDLEQLLAQSDWVTALARFLVADVATADDVVQATWLDVLQSPAQQSPRDERAWLGTLLGR